MPPRKKPEPKLLQRTPLAETIAAGLGLVLTLSVLGYSIWEAVADRPGPPELTVTAKAAAPTGAGFVVPIVVRNTSDETAAAVEVRGTLEADGRVIEERRTSFAYVPGGGEAAGGLVFEQDPRRHALKLRPEGYAEP